MRGDQANKEFEFGCWLIISHTFSLRLYTPVIPHSHVLQSAVVTSHKLTSNKEQDLSNTLHQHKLSSGCSILLQADSGGTHIFLLAGSTALRIIATIITFELKWTDSQKHPSRHIPNKNICDDSMECQLEYCDQWLERSFQLCLCVSVFCLSDFHRRNCSGESCEWPLHGFGDGRQLQLRYMFCVAGKKGLKSKARRFVLVALWSILKGDAQWWRLRHYSFTFLFSVQRLLVSGIFPSSLNNGNRWNKVLSTSY